MYKRVQYDLPLMPLGVDIIGNNERVSWVVITSQGSNWMQGLKESTPIYNFGMWIPFLNNILFVCSHISILSNIILYRHFIFVNKL